VTCGNEVSGRLGPGNLADMRDAELSLEITRTETEAVVTATGEIDGSTVARLTGVVDSVLVSAPPRVVLDLGGVTFCDSQGLGALVALSQKARVAQSVLVLTHVRPQMARALDVTGLRAVLLVASSSS
jgi:anti-sigma B factor antagonist